VQARTLAATGRKLPNKAYHFRVAAPEKSNALTGFKVKKREERVRGERVRSARSLAATGDWGGAW